MSANLRGLEKRIGRIEAATICVACQMPPDFFAEYISIRRRAGLPLSVDLADTYPSLCAYCGIVRRVPLMDFLPAERELIVRCSDAYDEGTFCLAEIESAFAERDELFKRKDAELYGPLLAEITDFHRRGRALQEKELAARRPVVPYLCRVEGCGCDYPKTVEEWRERVDENWPDAGGEYGD